MTEGGSEEDNHSDGGTTHSTDQMQGATAEDHMTGFDFADTWQLVIDRVQIDPTPAEDGYPILRAIDTRA